MNDKWDNANVNLPTYTWQKSRGSVHQIQILGKGLIDHDALPAASAGGGLSRMYAMLMATHMSCHFFLLPKMLKDDIMFLDND